MQEALFFRCRFVVLLVHCFTNAAVTSLIRNNRYVFGKFYIMGVNSLVMCVCLLTCVYTRSSRYFVRY